MFDDKSILITGGTGSFGQRCVKTILERFNPQRLIIFSRDEFKQYEMQQHFNAPCMRYFLGDVRDLSRLRVAFTRVDYVIHAAALKQVPMLEYNPGEAVKTNIIGAENIITAALEHEVDKVIALSTDKAAEPINLYGATKLVSDKLFVAANNMRGMKRTEFSVVRYGNVLGSRGSIIPLFKKHIDEGAEVLPVTDTEMTRFSITLQEGVDFVLSCFKRMQGGEIFIPKIPSYHILDIINAMAPAARVEIVGLRPGEKLHEIMCPSGSSRNTLEFSDHYVITPSFNFTRPLHYKQNIIGERGKPVIPGFEYSSLTNPDFLSIDRLKELITHHCA